MYKDAVAAVADKIAAMADRIGTEIESDSKKTEVKKTNSAGYKAMFYMLINSVHA